MLNNIDGCSIPTRKQIITIDKAKPGIRYPTEFAVNNVALALSARQIGENILWKPGISLSNAASVNPVFKGNAEQQYIIDIRTNSGCLTVDTQLVKTIREIKIYVPSAFTPNKDGKNDYLHPILMGVKDLHYFRVFNRWGNLVYESKSGQPGWDGNFKGIQQQSQALVWVVEGVGVDGTVYMQKGTAVLIR